MEPVSALLGALGLGSSLGGLFSSPAPEVLKPQAGPGLLPNVAIGDLQTQWSPMDFARAGAMAPNLPQGMPIPMNMLAATRTDAQGQQPILQALQQAAQAAPAAGDALARIPSGNPTAAPKAPAPSKAPAPGTMPTEKISAGGAPQKSSFLGMDGDQWGAIGVASGILANLFRPGPAPQVLTPSGGGPGALPSAPLGADLYQPGSQRLGTTSQFAINSPSTGGAYGAKTSDLLKALQG